MRIFTLLLMSIGIFSAVPVHAAAGDELQAVVETLEKSYNSLTDMQAEFAQRTLIASIKREEKGSGEVFLKKPADGPAMFRFNYRKPQQQIVSNGKKVWYYLPENKQVMVSDMAALFEGGKGVALNYLTGMGRISRDFSISFSGKGRDKNGNYVLDLVPKKESPTIAKLQLTVDGAAVQRFREQGKADAQFPVLSSAVTDSLGNRTTIDFSRTKVNRGIGNDRFNFKVPAGVEVIQN